MPASNIPHRGGIVWYWSPSLIVWYWSPALIFGALFACYCLTHADCLMCGWVLLTNS